MRGDGLDDEATRTGADVVGEGEELDPRMRAAWRTWLSALAVDAEAAVAAALAYESLAPLGRDAWLDALGEDAAGLSVPAIALYAPLLAVEEDEARRLRMTRALSTCGGATLDRGGCGGPLALCGEARSGERVSAIVSPVYLDFVEVLVCRYRPDRGFISARHDPIRNAIDVVGRSLRRERETTSARHTCIIDGVLMTEVPLHDVVEDLAHAVVADRRERRATPEALSGYAHLFSPDAPRPGLVDPKTPGAFES
jgi:hypothetical protein